MELTQLELIGNDSCRVPTGTHFRWIKAFLLALFLLFIIHSGVPFPGHSGPWREREEIWCRFTALP